VDANIQSVVHFRDKKTSRGTVYVKVVAETTPENIDKILDKLIERGISVASCGEERLVEEGSVLVIGHIIHSDIRDTIDKIDSTGYAEVVELKISMPAIEKPSAAYLVIRAKTKRHLQKAIDILKQVSEDKELLVVEPISGTI